MVRVSLGRACVDGEISARKSKNATGAERAVALIEETRAGEKNGPWI